MDLLIGNRTGHDAEYPSRWPYRFFFYSGDRGQPPHVHVERDSRIAKFWLDPLEPARSGGLRQRDINNIQRIIAVQQQSFLERWNENFGGS